MSEGPVYATNALGDVHLATDPDGTVRAINPFEWGWLTAGGANDPAEGRRSVDSLAELPGFKVTPDEHLTFVPGSKSSDHSWEAWSAGTAPPAAVESIGGTRAYFNRLSEASGYVADALAGRREPDMMYIYDFVGGLLHTVEFVPPVATTGSGIVYLLDDGHGIKVGWTTGPVAARLNALQTGNSRRIGVLAEIRNAENALESHLHDVLGEWNIGGEWFARSPLLRRITASGSVESWLRDLIGPNRGLDVVVHPPYR